MVDLIVFLCKIFMQFFLLPTASIYFMIEIKVVTFHTYLIHFGVSAQIVGSTTFAYFGEGMFGVCVCVKRGAFTWLAE